MVRETMVPCGTTKTKATTHAVVVNTVGLAAGTTDGTYIPMLGLEVFSLGRTMVGKVDVNTYPAHTVSFGNIVSMTLRYIFHRINWLSVVLSGSLPDATKSWTEMISVTTMVLQVNGKHSLVPGKLQGSHLNDGFKLRSPAMAMLFFLAKSLQVSSLRISGTVAELGHRDQS
jgi:hypothetical protein